MFKGKIIVIASLSLALLLSSSAFAQDKGKRVGAKQKSNAAVNNNRKNGKYANQEVSYRKTNTARKFDKGYLPPAGTNQTANNRVLPYIEQDNLKTPKPKQQNLLPYLEQSNLRNRKAQTRK